MVSLNDLSAAQAGIYHFTSAREFSSAQRLAEVIADALTRSGRHDVLIKTIRELRQGGPLSPWLELYEADLVLLRLAQGDAMGAKTCLENLAQHVDGKIASAALICLARVCLRDGDVDESRSLLLRAKTLKEGLAPPDTRGLPYILNELGRLALRSEGGVKSALKLHDAALRIQQSLGDVKGQAHTLRRIGSIFLRDKGDPKRALNYLAEACTAAERAGSTLILVHSLIELADAEQKLGDFTAALGHLDQARSLAKRSSDPFTGGRVEVRRGQLFERLELWASAQTAYKSSAELLVLVGDREEQRQIAVALARVQAEIEKFQTQIKDWDSEIERLNTEVTTEMVPEKRAELRRLRKHASRMRKRARQKLGLETSQIRMRSRDR